MAAELIETVTPDGVEQRFPIACLFDLPGSLTTRVKVFRAGTADLP